MSYKEGIINAVTELKDRNGSSMIAIKKHMQEHMPKDKKWLNATFLTALKNGVAADEFVKIKASYKLSADFKKKLLKKDAPKKAAPKKAAAKKTTAKKTTAKKATATKKTTATKKKTTATKKTATAKAVSILLGLDSTEFSTPR
jgi:histone H1/5